MEKEWNAYPKGINDTETKYYMICQLVRNVSKDELCMESFQRQYTDLAYIERRKSDTRRNKIIDETLVWAKENNSKRLVNPVFRLLGAESLVEKYIKGEKTRKYSILKLGFRHSDFADDAFQDTFIKLSDAMLHIYGTSRSARLNAILTHLGGCHE